MRQFLKVWHAIVEMLHAVADAGPVGWMGVVAIAALSLAGFAIYAIVKIIIVLKG